MGFKNLRTSSPGAWFIIVALFVAGAAGLLVFNAVRLAAPTVPVIVAKADIEPGQTITEDMLDIKNYPKAILPGDRIRGGNFDTMIGHHAKTFIAAGDPIRIRHVSELSPDGGTVAARLTFTEHPNWRAIALPAEASQGLGVTAGDKVDIIGTVDVNNPQGNVTTTKVLVWGAPVISTPNSEDDEKNDAGIVVALNSKDAERVSLAMLKGDVLVALNPLGEVSGRNSTGITMSEIFSQQGGVNNVDG